MLLEIKHTMYLFKKDLNGLKIKKAKPESLSVVKEDREAFRVILGTNTDFSEALNYHIANVSLTLQCLMFTKKSYILKQTCSF